MNDDCTEQPVNSQTRNSPWPVHARAEARLRLQCGVKGVGESR